MFLPNLFGLLNSENWAKNWQFCAGLFRLLQNENLANQFLDVATRCTLQSIVNRPTRCGNILDRIYVNEPCYTSVRVITFTVKSDHKAVIAYAGSTHL